MAEAHPVDEKVPLAVDEASSVKYSSLIHLWPDPTQEALYFGNIFLDSVNAKSTVAYKLRVLTKQKHKKMVRCSQGQGLLQPNNFHKITVNVKEEAIASTEVHLHLGDSRVILKMEKSQAGEHFYNVVKKDEEIPVETEEKPSRWQMTDQNLAKIMPSNVQQYIKDEQRDNLRRAVFSMVYPLILEICGRIDERGPSPPARLDAAYFDGLDQATADPVDQLTEYVLKMLEEEAQKEPAGQV